MPRTVAVRISNTRCDFPAETSQLDETRNFFANALVTTQADSTIVEIIARLPAIWAGHANTVNAVDRWIWTAFQVVAAGLP
jgi:hypothetical protein